MGVMISLKCSKCGFEVNAGTEQPYYIMSGSITDKYCPKIGKIISVFTKYYDNITKISCLPLVTSRNVSSTTSPVSMWRYSTMLESFTT